MTKNTINRAKVHSSGDLQHYDLDNDSLPIVTFSYSIFSNNKYFETQAGNTILLTNKSRKAN